MLQSRALSRHHVTHGARALVAACVAMLAIGCGDLATLETNAADGSATTPTADAAMIDGGARPPGDGGEGGAGALDARTDASDGGAAAGWTLFWRDEFNGADGTPVDPQTWKEDVGNGGWSNNHERQYYTSGTDNAVVQGGSLVITAKSQGADQYACQYGTCLYTSARLSTRGHFSQKYGRFESRIKITRGKGMWPAWWMLGEDIGTVGWPQCGEIDIMENVGNELASVHGSLHGPGYSGTRDLTAAYSLPGNAALADNFHVYAVEWEENAIRFYLDDHLYETRTPVDVPAGSRWVYDHPFFLIFNVAVGGYWPGDPDATTALPQTMEIDYVRVYRR